MDCRAACSETRVTERQPRLCVPVAVADSPTAGALAPWSDQIESPVATRPPPADIFAAANSTSPAGIARRQNPAGGAGLRRDIAARPPFDPSTYIRCSD